MVDIFPAVYIAMQVIAVLMAWPQIRKLYLSKRSDSLSLSTWVTWLLSALVTIAYAYTTNQPIWMGANIAWSLFYGTMVTMIIRYRNQNIYEQVINLFHVRFYLSIRRAEAPHTIENPGFLSKFRWW